MKYSNLIIMLVILLGFTACTVNPTALEESADTTPPTNETVPAEKLSLNTRMGEFVIASARFVDDVNGEKPGPGEKLLLVALTRPGMESIDPSNFSLEEFQSMVQDTTQGMIHILGEDGSQTISSMAGWVGPEYKEFGMGFRLPSSVTAYQLVWPGNDPLAIVPEE